MRKVIHTLLRIAFVSAFIFLALAVSAAAEEAYKIAVSECTPERIVYSVTSEETGVRATAITATYLGGRLCETKTDGFITDEEPHTASQTLSLPYDNIKIMLVDSETNVPLCGYAGKVTVRFTDHTGQTVFEQNIFSGQTAIPPSPPERDGFVFVKWGADYKNVFEDTVIPAIYTEDAAANIFTVSSASAEAGDEVRVTVKLSGTVNLCAFDLRLRYDDELEFVSMNTALSFDLLANHAADKKYIRLNFQTTSNINEGGDIIEVVFRAKNKGAASLKPEPVSVIYIDPADSTVLSKADHTACEGVIVIR
ncbi:MAG: hypothetical protein IJS65_07805 [Clostridia bacterium]|nr:hypothetical protein [Clostridia bacterium]